MQPGTNKTGINGACMMRVLHDKGLHVSIQCQPSAAHISIPLPFPSPQIATPTRCIDRGCCVSSKRCLTACTSCWGKPMPTSPATCATSFTACNSTNLQLPSGPCLCLSHRHRQPPGADAWTVAAVSHQNASSQHSPSARGSLCPQTQIPVQHQKLTAIQAICTQAPGALRRLYVYTGHWQRVSGVHR